MPCTPNSNDGIDEGKRARTHPVRGRATGIESGIELARSKALRPQYMRETPNPNRGVDAFGASTHSTLATQEGLVPTRETAAPRGPRGEEERAERERGEEREEGNPSQLGAHHSGDGGGCPRRSGGPTGRTGTSPVYTRSHFVVAAAVCSLLLVLVVLVVSLLLGTHQTPQHLSGGRCQSKGSEVPRRISVAVKTWGPPRRKEVAMPAPT